MKKLAIAVIVALTITLTTIITVTAFASLPETINYQGYLKKGDGTPVTTATSIRFSLYSSNPARNNPVWSETQSVTPANGIYSVHLGSATPFAIPFDVPYYLGLKVGSDPEMNLQPLEMAPFAVRAAWASNIDNGAVSSTNKFGFRCEPGAILVSGNNGWDCGTVSPLPNGAGTCSAGNCKITACLAGFADCDGNAANGCETSLSTTQNCGSCGHVCTSDNAVTVCLGGVTCIPTCNPGWTFCGDPAGGCTINWQKDPSNCGGCGGTCASGEYCMKGACGPCQALVINELFVDPTYVRFLDYAGLTLGPMQVPSVQAFKYIELFNACPTETIDLTGWELSGALRDAHRPVADLGGVGRHYCQRRLPGGGKSDFTPKDMTIGGVPTDQLFGLRLIRPSRFSGMQTEVDFVTWNQYFFGSDPATYNPAKILMGLPDNNGQFAVSRIPNGIDTGNNGDDFRWTDLSPGAANVALHDSVKNGTETDVDCGGLGVNPRCGIGQSCLKNSDCQEGLCTSGVCRSSLCTDPACIDGIRNGTETDVDCGGGALNPRCMTGKSCLQDADCSTSYCLNGVCTVPTCNDGLKNGTETDTDCGGSCNGCSTGSHCLQDADCQRLIFLQVFPPPGYRPPSYCNAGACAEPTCIDGIKNGWETDVDCGGRSCDACPAGKHCNSNSECQSQVCSNGLCVEASCRLDGVKNGTETDVDCGGSCVNKCAISRACQTDGDCSSVSCVEGRCLECGTNSPPTACGGYRCYVPSNHCASTCTNDSECAEGYYCNGSSCLAKKTDGTPCNANNQCFSGYCIHVTCQSL